MGQHLPGTAQVREVVRDQVHGILAIVIALGVFPTLAALGRLREFLRGLDVPHLRRIALPGAHLRLQAIRQGLNAHDEFGGVRGPSGLHARKEVVLLGSVEGSLVEAAFHLVFVERHIDLVLVATALATDIHDAVIAERLENRRDRIRDAGPDVFPIRLVVGIHPFPKGAGVLVPHIRAVFLRAATAALGRRLQRSIHLGRDVIRHQGLLHRNVGGNDRREFGMRGIHGDVVHRDAGGLEDIHELGFAIEQGAAVEPAFDQCLEDISARQLDFVVVAADASGLAFGAKNDVFTFVIEVDARGQRRDVLANLRGEAIPGTIQGDRVAGALHLHLEPGLVSVVLVGQARVLLALGVVAGDGRVRGEILHWTRGSPLRREILANAIRALRSMESLDHHLLTALEIVRQRTRRRHQRRVVGPLLEVFVSGFVRNLFSTESPALLVTHGFCPRNIRANPVAGQRAESARFRGQAANNEAIRGLYDAELVLGEIAILWELGNRHARSALSLVLTAVFGGDVLAVRAFPATKITLQLGFAHHGVVVGRNLRAATTGLNIGHIGGSTFVDRQVIELAHGLDAGLRPELVAFGKRHALHDLDGIDAVFVVDGFSIELRLGLRLRRILGRLRGEPERFHEISQRLASGGAGKEEIAVLAFDTQALALLSHE